MLVGWWSQSLSYEWQTYMLLANTITGSHFDEQNLQQSHFMGSFSVKSWNLEFFTESGRTWWGWLDCMSWAAQPRQLIASSRTVRARVLSLRSTRDY